MVTLGMIHSLWDKYVWNKNQGYKDRDVWSLCLEVIQLTILNFISQILQLNFYLIFKKGYWKPIKPYFLSKFVAQCIVTMLQVMSRDIVTADPSSQSPDTTSNVNICSIEPINNTRQPSLACVLVLIMCCCEWGRVGNRLLMMIVSLAKLPQDFSERMTVNH